MGWTTYSDVGEVYELGAVFDDVLKKDMDFINYAVALANRIIMDRGWKALATYGKWGARLEPDVNPHLTKQQISQLANLIITHKSWGALKESTRVFTYGQYEEGIYEYQQILADKNSGDEKK